MSDEQTQATDDPSGPGWRDVLPGEILHVGDMVQRHHGWSRTRVSGTIAGSSPRYRRRIEQQQPSDSEPETMEDLRRRLAECEVLLAEAGGSGEQVNAELQQLRKQAQNLTRELKDKSDSYQICLRNHYKAGQRSAIDRLQTWLRPVVKVVDNHPEFGATLAVTVLGFLPHIADRLIEE